MVGKGADARIALGIPHTHKEHLKAARLLVHLRMLTREPGHRVKSPRDTLGGVTATGLITR